MVGGGRLHCLGCFCDLGAVLLLWICLGDVEASSCQREIHKRVGDTVELSTCLPSEGVTLAQWRFGQILITNFKNTFDKKPFEGRLDINQENFNLIIKDLTLQDSGEFSFQSGVNGQQRDNTFIMLKVHESVAKPDITGNSTWDSLDDICIVVLDCGSISDTNVSYKWTVRNQTISSSLLRYKLREEDGETTFTCTISNPVSEMSTSKTVKCTRDNQEITKEEQIPKNDSASVIVQHNQSDSEKIIIILGSAGGAVLIMVIVSVVAWCCWKKRKSAAETELNDQTIYADINEITAEDGMMKSCSVYETVDNRAPVTMGPQTIYDKIQLSRVGTPSVSPYQEIS